MKPVDRDLTYEELTKMFSSWCEIGLMSFDVAFSRTSQEEAEKYAEFILENKDSIQYVRGGDELIDRYKLTEDQNKVIAGLELPEEEPEKLPLDEQNRPSLQSGLFLCKSFSPKPFWIVFGNVEEPTFMKTRIYKNDLYNNIYRDKSGYAYMLIPLMPINNKELEFFDNVYRRAWDLGLREDAYLIAPFIYGLDLTNFDGVVEDFRKTYTKEELIDTFKKVFGYIKNFYPYDESYKGYYFSDHDQKFKGWNSHDDILRAKLSPLTCLLRAITKEFGSIETAQVMKEVTGKYYVKAEFR